MKPIITMLLMCAAPILNMSGLVELKTLRDVAVGVVIGTVLAMLPEGFKR